MSSRLPSRLGAFLGLLVAGALGLLARSGALEPLLAKYLGVAFWACGVYFLVRLARGPAPDWSRCALAAIAISWAVEFAQLTPLPRFLSSRHWLLRVAFGESFSVWDLPAYLAGVAMAAVIDAILIGRMSLGSVGRGGTA